MVGSWWQSSFEQPPPLLYATCSKPPLLYAPTSPPLPYSPLDLSARASPHLSTLGARFSPGCLFAILCAEQALPAGLFPTLFEALTQTDTQYSILWLTCSHIMISFSITLVSVTIIHDHHHHTASLSILLSITVIISALVVRHRNGGNGGYEPGHEACDHHH